MRAVARQGHVSLSTVQRWVQRAAGERLDRVDWTDRPTGCRPAINRVAAETEDLVLRLRRELKATSDLGEYGAVAIQHELQSHDPHGVPSVRTIGRVLERRGALDGRQRRRHPAPPPGWYLPTVAQRQAELDSFDTVAGLVIRGGTDVEVLNGISLHGGLAVAWPRTAITAKTAVELLLEHWRTVGLPTYAQFDNDSRFQGTHKHPDSIGRMPRVCLSLDVVPVFAPPREMGFQAAIESFNGRWQAKVWARFQHASLAALQSQSARFVAALRARSAPRFEAAPPRRPFPADWILNLQRPLQGRMIFLRRTNDHGDLHLLGRTYPVSPIWVHRLVRAELHLAAGRIDFYALRRRDPSDQPLLGTVSYAVPRKPFWE